MSALAFVEMLEGSVTGGSLTALAAAIHWTSITKKPAFAALFAPEPTEGVMRLRQRIREMGFSRFYTCFSPHLMPYRGWLFASLLRQVQANSPAELFFFPDSFFSREVGARLAQEFDAPFLTDVEGIIQKDSTLLWKKSTFGGKFEVLVEFTKIPAVLQVVSGAFAEVSHPSENWEEISLSMSQTDFSEEEVGRYPAERLVVKLEEASVIVSGGRGLGDPKGFQLIQQVAKALGGEVGASRAVVDLGWIPYAHQVGQTGKTVRPKLYIAAGISGSVQHRAGMQNSEIIIAINKDAHAPIFSISDYGVVADLYEILPAVLKAIERHKLVPKS